MFELLRSWSFSIEFKNQDYKEKAETQPSSPLTNSKIAKQKSELLTC